jgi:hypothetical protein
MIGFGRLLLKLARIIRAVSARQLPSLELQVLGDLDDWVLRFGSAMMRPASYCRDAEADSSFPMPRSVSPHQHLYDPRTGRRGRAEPFIDQPSSP